MLRDQIVAEMSYHWIRFFCIILSLPATLHRDLTAINIDLNPVE